MSVLDRRFINNRNVIGLLIQIPKPINITEVLNTCIMKLIQDKFTALLLENHIFIIIDRYNKFPFNNTYKACSSIISSLIKYSLDIYGTNYINGFNCEIFLSCNITDMVKHMENKRKRVTRKILVKHAKQSGLVMDNITLKTHNNEQLLNLLEKSGVDTAQIKNEMLGELYEINSYSSENNSRDFIKFNNKTLKYLS